jgi:NAD(P)-dependent dehydrogenase (short-subunit alcohol dehydrogenase family)
VIVAIYRASAAGSDVGGKSSSLFARCNRLRTIEGVHAAGFIESDLRKQMESQTPLGRIGQVEDIAPAAVFFASNDAQWITGESLVVAGGFR